MDSEDGQVFVKNLSSFVSSHERALANALQSHRRRDKDGQQPATAGASSSSSLPTSISLSEALSRPYFPFFTQKIHAVKLTLTPHHLFYLLSKFEELGVDIGPMNVRLENLQHPAGPSNYVSFLGSAPKSRGKQADEESLKSVSSVRSVMSSMSSLWSNLTNTSNATKIEKQMTQYRDDIKYLYASFTKLPALKLSPDHRVKLVAGFEEFPFDTAVPLFAFKNVSSLEICDLDFRQFYGWDRLAEQLRTLTVRRANVDDPIDLLQHIVLDDMEKRRKRSFKTQLPATPSTPGAPWPTNSPRLRQAELNRTMSAPTSPFVDLRRASKNSPPNIGGLERKDSSNVDQSSAGQQRERSNSPLRPTSQQDSRMKHARSGSMKFRRSSDSSKSSGSRDVTPRHSTSDLLPMFILPSSKWQFLQHLGLTDNGLHSLTVASLAPVAGTLQSLDLSGNLFTEVPDALASLSHLRALNLSNCMIDSLQSLARHPLPAIIILNLRSNRLLNLSGIERLISLERVDLRDNRLRDPTELARLTAFPNITDLYVLKNPFTRTHSNYRVTIFNLFRKTPGHVQDITIDYTGPLYSEKKQLIDRVPEPASVPVIKPPMEDEEEIPEAGDGATAADDGMAAPRVTEEPAQPRGHRRATSDLGPQTMRRSKKPPRRRIIELSPQESPARPKSQKSQKSIPDLAEAAAPKTPTDSDHPSTPEQTPYQTAPTTQVPMLSSPKRPTLDAAFESPTPAPKIRDPSDDDDDEPPMGLSQDINHSDMYRQKIEAIKKDFGSGWLTALNDERVSERRTQDRGFSPASRSSTIRPDDKSGHGAAGFGSRALG